MLKRDQNHHGSLDGIKPAIRRLMGVHKSAHIALWQKDFILK